MRLSGKVYMLPPAVFHDVNTDAIIAGKHLRLPEEEFGKHAFEGIVPEFVEEVRHRPILLCGRNMGCGSSREQAPKALMHAGVKVVLAESFGYIFYRNAVNLGLPVLQYADADRIHLLEDAEVTVDLDNGVVETADGERVQAVPPPPIVRRILSAGGLFQALSRGDLAGGGDTA